MPIREIREILENHDWTSGPGTSADELVEAERILGEFPGDYKEFLAEFGWLEFGSCEVYGLGVDKPDYVDVIRMTLLERSQPAVPLPNSWVCVMNDGAGNLVSFDTARVAEGSSPMLLWDHELGESQRPEILASSFQEWLAGMLHAEAAS